MRSTHRCDSELFGVTFQALLTQILRIVQPTHYTPFSSSHTNWQDKYCDTMVHRIECTFFQNQASFPRLFCVSSRCGESHRRKTRSIRLCCKSGNPTRPSHTTSSRGLIGRSSWRNIDNTAYAMPSSSSSFSSSSSHSLTSYIAQTTRIHRYSQEHAGVGCSSSPLTAEADTYETLDLGAVTLTLTLTI